MEKNGLLVGLSALVLSACSSTPDEVETPPPAPAYQVPLAPAVPVVEISGVEPRYEPLSPTANRDYQLKGRSYHIVRDTRHFSEVGLAVWYGAEAQGNRTASGETFDPNGLTAAHPTLPIPSYVRVTNLSNDRQLVVRVNDRGPYTAGRVIDLSQAAANRLNLSSNTKVRIDVINVSPDGALSGPGSIGTAVAKQSYALPSRPGLGSSATGTPPIASSATQSLNTSAIPVNMSVNNDMPVPPVSGSTTVQPFRGYAVETDETQGARIEQSVEQQGGGFLQRTQPLPPGVLESSAPPSLLQQASVLSVPVSDGRYLVQVGALSHAERAQNWQQSLSRQFGVTGKVSSAKGNIYRVLLGPFQQRQQAETLQQRLVKEAQQQSIIIVDN